MDDTLKAGLEAWVRERDPNARLGDVKPLTGGVSARMYAFEAVTGDATARYIIRQPNALMDGGSPAGARNEHRLLAWLDESGAAVQQVFDLDVFGARFGAPSLILEFVDGAPDFNPEDPILYAKTMAGCLRHIHWHGRAQNDLDFLPEIAERAGSYFGRLRDSLPADADERPWLASLDGRFPPEERNDPTLLHGDFWPGNVLWDGDHVSAIIDWEEACWGDPLADLAISRLDILWMLDAEAMEAFTRHYLEITEVDPTRLPEWDLGAAIRPAGALELWAAPWPGHGRPDITATAMAEKRRWFAAQALRALI